MKLLTKLIKNLGFTERIGDRQLYWQTSYQWNMSDKIYFLGTNFPQPIPLAFDITDENKILNDILFDDGFLLIIKILMEYLPKCQQNILLVFSNFLVVY
jgi:hypothetical protein